MLIGYKRGQTSVVLRVKLLDSTVTTGAGKAGLSSTSSGLIISTIADNESTATAYTVTASNIQTISTLGTYSAPTSGKCRFAELDSTNHKGVYEIQIADARFAVSSAKSMLVSVSGANGTAECDVVIPLRDLDPYDSVRAGLTALPNAMASSSSGLLTFGTSTGQINPTSGKIPATLANADVAGNLAADVQTIKAQTVTCAAGVTILASLGTASTSTAQSGDAFARIGANGAGLTSVALAPTGLDAISTAAPSGVAGNFREMVVQTWRRFFKKVRKTSSAITTYADNGTTVLTTQTISDDGAGTQDQGAAS